MPVTMEMAGPETSARWNHTLYGLVRDIWQARDHTGGNWYIINVHPELAKRIRAALGEPVAQAERE